MDRHLTRIVALLAESARFYRPVDIHLRSDPPLWRSVTGGRFLPCTRNGNGRVSGVAAAKRAKRKRKNIARGRA